MNLHLLDEIIRRRDELRALRPVCPSCKSTQVQVIDTRVPSGWKCRVCHHTFAMETDHD